MKRYSNDYIKRVEARLGMVIFISFFIAMVGGCVYIVNNPLPDNNIKPQSIVKYGCRPIIIPDIPPIPPVVTLTDSQLKNKSLSDDALVGNIKDLREWGRLAEERYRKAIQEQLDSCKY